MYLLCHIELAIVILLINEFISETTGDFEASGDATIDIDDENSEIIDYKKIKQARPYVFQNDTVRIVGGQSTTIEKYPFIVSLQLIGDSHICGGSIINTLWVISASHCITECDADPCIHESVKDPTDFQIVAGASDAKPMEYGQVREIERFVKHPGFSRPLLHDDIALIKVKNPFEFTKSVQPITLPKLDDLRDSDISETYKECLALGWGAQKPRSGKNPEDLTEQEKKDIETDLVAPMLMVVSLPTIPIKLCKYTINHKYITNRHLCTMYEQGGKDACEGDSGGPLVCGGILHGVTSWGHGCARRNTPGVFTRVDTYEWWIANILSGGPNIDNYRSSSNELVFLKWILLINFFLIIIVLC